MSSSKKYIYDLEYDKKHELCRILDADQRWKELGGKYMKYDDITLALIGRAVHCDKSPTSELLAKYGERNGTVKALFNWLCRMNHQRAASILMPYVDKKYHRSLSTESTYTTSLLNYSSIGGISRHSVSGISITSTDDSTCNTQGASSNTNAAEACRISSKEVENTYSKNSKFENKSSINSDQTSNPWRCKIRNVAHVKPKAIAKISPRLKQVKQNTYLEQDFISDVSKSSKIFQEMILKGKHSNLPSGDSLPNFMNIPFSEIHKITDFFSKDKILGQGGFGTVYKAQWQGISVAIKRLNCIKSVGPERQVVNLKQYLNELNILKCCRFDYILPLYAVSLDSDNPCLIYKLMVNGSLEDRLQCKKKSTPLSWLQRSHIAECVAKGLNYLHTTYEKPLLHGDIKSANILLDSNMEAKIGDFGLTREGPNCDNTHVKVTSIHGTLCYLPHEYLRYKKLSPQVDIYSFGVVMLEIATGLRAFEAQTKTILVQHVKTKSEAGNLVSLRDAKAGEENAQWFKEIIKIGQVCSSFEKKNRPPIQEVLSMFEKAKTNLMIDKIRYVIPAQFAKLNLTDLKVDASVIPVVMDQLHLSSFNSNESEYSSENLEETDSYISFDSSSSSGSELSSNQELIKRRDSSPDNVPKGEVRVPPIPFLTHLNFHESKTDSEQSDTEKSM